MKQLNNNVFLVLTSIRDKDGDIGLCESKGMTKDRIKERTNLSMTTINRALKILVDFNFINEGIMNISKKTYYITEQGIKKLKDINKKSI